MGKKSGERRPSPRGRGLEGKPEATDLLDPEAVRMLVMGNAQSIRDFMRATMGRLRESSTSDRPDPAGRDGRVQQRQSPRLQFGRLR